MRRFTRRQAIALGVVGVPGAALAALALRHAQSSAPWVSDDERRNLRALDPREFATLKMVMARIARASVPGFPDTFSVGAALFADRYLSAMPWRDLRDVQRLLMVVEHVLPVRVGTTLPFSRADGADQDAVLHLMETSVVSLLRVGLAALKQITALAYFRHPSTWPAIGYSGPLVPSVRDHISPRPALGAVLPRASGTTFDAVVVGAGAGGSMAAREIARSGARVLLLDEGPDHPPESFSQREDEMLPVLYQDRGARTTSDRAIMVLQGRGLGGSTIHNQNLCKRAPREILDAWSAAGLHGWSAADLDPLFAEVERDLHVTPIDAADINANNDVLRRGAERLGWRAGGLSHNRDGCRRSGFCELGCAYDGKNNARKIVIPQAVDAGAVVRADTRVERVLVRDGRAVGVAAIDSRTGRAITIRARSVVLAGSAVGSAALAVSSELRDPYDRAGVGLHMHPAGVVAGVFDDAIVGWQGIPQSWECTEWLDFRSGSGRNVWIVPGFAHPVGTAAMLPGIGPAWTGIMKMYPRVAVLIAMLHDESAGRVRVRNGRPAIDYELNESDRAGLARGLRACAEILFAAGARWVVVPFTPPVHARRLRELPTFSGRDVAPHALAMTAVHPMSTMRAGRDPRTSVCDPRGAHHHVRGLYVADGGLFPTSLGGPPQISIYTAGLKVGRHVAEDLRRG